MLEQWISATAWPMTPPSAYGSFHLLFLCFGLGISACTCVSSSQVQRRLLPPNFTRCRTVFDRL